MNRVELRAGTENGGDGISKGNVYAMNRDGLFGPIFDSFTTSSTSAHQPNITCRQLGFNYGIGHYRSYFGDVEEDFYVMKFNSFDDCTGNEEFLQQCEYAAYINTTSYLHTRAFGVECF